MKKSNFFTIITKIILIILPFYVFLSLILKNVTGIDFIWIFLKEFLLILAFLWVIYEFIKAKKFPKFDILDYLIFGFIWYWIAITFINWLWIKSLFYGWRYDFIFFVAFLIYKHWAQFLKESWKNLIKLFFISASISLLIWVTIKFSLKEEFLLLFWYVDYSGNWIYNWWVPIYHWLENSWTRRFQWILDWPNMMWFFLILYSGIFLFLQNNKKEFYVFLVLAFLAVLLYITFSRSAILWVLAWVWILFLVNLKTIFQKHKKVFLTITAISSVFIILILSIFLNPIKNIVLRESSTEWHFSRMIIWIERFIQKPFWAWLAESWPAFRSIYPDKQTLEFEQYYIPESWFIQVLVEGWIIYFLLFLTILWIIWTKLYKKSIFMFVSFFAILVMNVFLHIFEATYLSILLFILIWLIIYKD